MSPTVGLAIIAKNEAQRLPDLLRSIDGAFDQVVLVDTGSIDRTIQLFKGWAATQDDLDIKVEYFHWTKDFSAAREFAHSLLDTDWQVWADCDDVIVGAQNLRSVAAQAPDHIAAYIASYNYAQHPQTGQCICSLRRERLVRRGASKWVNRVHEAQVVEGLTVVLDSSVVEWVHRKQHVSVEEMQASDARRNLDILEDWVKDDPENTRVLAYLGTENAARGEVDLAIPFFEQYFRHDPDWDEERAQVHRKLAQCYLVKQMPDVAISTAFDAMKVLPRWPDSHVTLAEAYFLKEEHHKAAEWAREALRIGPPETLLIINPLDYTYQPRKILAGALAELGQFDEAIQVGSEAWELNPADEGLAVALQGWRGTAKRDHTANTIGMMVQQLVAHDEQLKARTLLEECVPHFANDHPGIVNLRSEMRERLAWVDDPHSLLDHYAEGGSKPEDFLPDDKLDEVAGALPRTMFLYQGIHHQLLESHQDGLIEAAVIEQVPAMMEAISGDPPQEVS